MASVALRTLYLSSTQNGKFTTRRVIGAIIDLPANLREFVVIYVLPSGGIPTKKGNPPRAWIDCRVPSYQKFVVDHLVDLLSIVDNTSTSSSKPLFDAVYSDGYGNQTIPGISAADNVCTQNQQSLYCLVHCSVMCILLRKQ